MKKAISVIIPAYNRRRQLRRAVESVFAQKGDFELVVVDDGSEDDLSSVKDLVESQGHKFIRTENHGVAAARNFGISQSSGDYLAFLDSDDEWLPGKLAAQLEFFELNPEMRICQAKEIWIRNGVRVNPKQYHQMPNGEAFEASLQRCLISPSSVMLERALFDEIGGFDERFIVCEDYDLWLRITSVYPVGLVETEYVKKYGGHADQLSRSQPVMDRFRVYSMLSLLGRGGLSVEQRKFLVGTLRDKAKIIADGAFKRGISYGENYEKLFSFVSENQELLISGSIDEIKSFSEDLESHTFGRK